MHGGECHLKSDKFAKVETGFTRGGVLVRYDRDVTSSLLNSIVH